MEAFYAYHWETVPPEKVHPGITRQQIDGEHVTVVRYQYAPGSVYPEHSHPEEQVSIVIRGPVRVTVADVTKSFWPGDVVVIPGAAPHAIHAPENTPAETITVIAPARGR